MTPTLDDIKL